MGDHFELPGDDRAVSTVIGFIMIFAMLIILLSTYQALWVPIQNEQVEYDHYQTVSDDMTDARSAIFEARTNGETQSTTVKLGTRYPTRLIAVNPPPATGRLETGPRRNISIAYQDGTEIDMAARYPGINSEDEIYIQFLSYSPNYNELDTGAPIRHEHGLLYKNFAETGQGGGLVIQNKGQTLVRTYEQGTNEVTLVPIQGNYSEQGVERVSLDPEPGILVSREFTDVNVTVPTDLRESTWEDVLSGQMAPEDIVVNEGAGELTLVLDGTWDVQYAPIGVDGTPISGERGSANNEINPASPGDVRLIKAEIQNGDWVLTFENQGNTINVSEGRVNFYDSQGAEKEKVIGINDPVANRVVEWNIGDNFETLDPPIRFSGNSQTDVTFDFDKNANPNDWWILTVIFETGEQGMYFIAEGGTAVDNGGGGDIGDPLPSNVVAYFDENDNGVYDNGEEAYSVSDLEGVSIGGTLRVVEDAIMEDGALTGIDIDAENIVFENGAAMETTGGGQSIDLTATATINIDSASLQSAPEITIDAGGQLTAEGAEIETTDGGGDINLISGSEMNINSANIQSIAPITIDAGQQLNSDGASIVATGGGSNVEISSGADALLSGANVESGSDVEIFSGADILLSGANVGGVNIRLDSSGSMNLNMSTLDVVASWADLSADLQGNADLFVENAEFTAAGQPATLDYKPISVNVIGEPAIGDTSGVGGGPP